MDFQSIETLTERELQIAAVAHEQGAASAVKAFVAGMRKTAAEAKSIGDHAMCAILGGYADVVEKQAAIG